MKRKIKAIFRHKKQTPSVAESARLEKYTTMQMLTLTLKFAKETLKSFRRRHELASRLVALSLALLIVYSILLPLLQTDRRKEEYNISEFSGLLEQPIQAYANKLTFNGQKQTYEFNEISETTCT